MTTTAYAIPMFGAKRRILFALVTDGDRTAVLLPGGGTCGDRDDLILAALSYRLAVAPLTAASTQRAAIDALGRHLSTSMLFGEERASFDDAVERARAMLMAQDQHEHAADQYPLHEPVPVLTSTFPTPDRRRPARRGGPRRRASAMTTDRAA